jgi:hypothetical protein
MQMFETGRIPCNVAPEARFQVFGHAWWGYADRALPWRELLLPPKLKRFDSQALEHYPNGIHVQQLTAALFSTNSMLVHQNSRAERSVCNMGRGYAVLRVLVLFPYLSALVFF